jgi:hypothetical protein
MHHHIDPVEPAFEEVPIGLELERIRYDTRGIRKHPIFGISMVYPPDAEPYISNSGDLTRDKIAKLVEMTMNND